jgi:hypothetical protein
VISVKLAKTGMPALAFARLECALNWLALKLQGSVQAQAVATQSLLLPTRHDGRMRRSRSRTTMGRINRK